jgi:Signal transduction histidine kinase
MNKLLDLLVNLGVQVTDSPYARRRIQFTNTLKLSVLGLFMVYFILSLASHSQFLQAICITLMLTAVGAIYLSYLRWYNIAFTLFLGGFNIAMVVCCNSLDDGSDFSIIYLSTLFLYGSIDGEKRIATLLLNLAISIGSFASVMLLPPHLWWRISLSPGWVSFYHIFNYSFTFSLSLFFTLSIARNQQRNARKLQVARKEAEDQKEAYLEEKNRAEAATQAKSQFLSQMSHELRTPLNGIIGSVHLLLDEEVHNSQKDHFKVLQYSSEHMLHLINDVLDFSKIEAGGMELSEATFNLNESLSKLKAIFEWQFKERGLNIYFDTNEELNRLFLADETRLIQVLSNLLGNALKFTIQGSVIVKVQVVSRGCNGVEVYFAVEDTGIGISEAQLEKIFEAFRQAESATTRKYGGTGLGLSISKALVSLLGGELQVESSPGKGSRFYFTLQLPFSNKAPDRQLRAENLNSLKGMRVLLVDDSPVNRKITRSFLERWEIKVEEASDGKEALELFSKGEYELLLLDLHMPVMDGYETIAEIRKTGSEVPALAFTAALLQDMKDQIHSQGFNGFLQKPFRPEELHRKISEVFKKVFK